jgi:ABC-2 type transport system permease protein
VSLDSIERQAVDTAEPTALPRARPVDTRAATLRAIYVIWKRDVIRYWRDRARFATSFMQPLLFLVVFGTGLASALRGLGGSFGHGLTYQQFIYPGIISMAVLFNSIFSAMSIVWDREFGFLREMLVAPIDRAAVAIGKTLGGATSAMFQGLLLLLLAPFLGVRLTPLSVLELVPLIFCLAFALSALGVVVASRMRSMQAFQFVINFLIQPAFFLSGALFPISGLPWWMTVATRLDPAAYGVDPLRRVVLETSGAPPAVLDRLALTLFGHFVPIWAEAGLLLAFGALMTALAVVNFRHQD